MVEKEEMETMDDFAWEYWVMRGQKVVDQHVLKDRLKSVRKQVRGWSFESTGCSWPVLGNQLGVKQAMGYGKTHCHHFDHLRIPVFDVGQDLLFQSMR